MLGGGRARKKIRNKDTNGDREKSEENKSNDLMM